MAAFVLCLVVLGPALTGPFVSDDYLWIVRNPYLTHFDLETLWTLVDPAGGARYLIGTWAPVPFVLHALERQAFGDAVVAYHVSNVLVHTLVCVLLFCALRASRVGPRPALLGAALFAVHPANVEAVAWISQLKTPVALALALGAVLASSRRGWLGALLFSLALLAKASAAFALPMAAALAWCRRDGPGGRARTWGWLGVWAGLFALFVLPQLESTAFSTAATVPAYDDAWVHARSIAAIGMRYLAMAATSYGVSAFHEPEPSLSWLDPWWLAALPAGALLGWRTIACLRRRKEEGAWWLGAATAFLPVSQIVPFQFGMADRYLYFVLPGLIGGALLLGAELRERLGPVPESPPQRRAAPLWAATAAVVALATVFAVRAHARAGLWSDPERLSADAALHYPNGGTAYTRRARQAARRGDVPGALAALRAAADRHHYLLLFEDAPDLAPLRDTPGFQALRQEVAGRMLEDARRSGPQTQLVLRGIAGAQAIQGDWEGAAETLEQAIRLGGPLTESLKRDLAGARAEAERRAREAPSERGGRPDL